MKKKIIAMLLVATLISLLFPSEAFAVDYYVSDGERFDLSRTVPNDFVEVGVGNSALFGTGNGINITCYAFGVHIDNATIYSDFVNVYEACTLNLVGTSTISSLTNTPGIECLNNLPLNIEGTGSLTIKGGMLSPGLRNALGPINISGGTLYVSGDVVNGEKDIECNSLSISGNAVLFLEQGKDNNTINLITTTHSYYEFANSSEVPAGYDVPLDWSYPIGAYMANQAPYFTGDPQNTSQLISPGEALTSLVADDPDGTDDIVSFTVTGGSLPTGITLNNNGSFTGSTNVSAGNYTATIEVADKGGKTDTTTLTIIVRNEAPYFTADTTNTSQTISIGGTPTALIAEDPNGPHDALSYSVIGGSLPTGVTLNNDGTFSGAASAGNYTATIEVRDSGGLTDTTTLSITVTNQPPYFTADSTNTSQTILSGNSLTALIAQDPDGAGDIVSFTVISGSLPTGITINNDGTFSGAATAGNYTATIEVRDAGGLTDTTTLDVTVNDILVTITPETATLGYSETCTLSATTDPAGHAITWHTADATIATVDSVTGVVTAGTKEGRVVISAHTTSGYDECVIYVVDKSEPAPDPSDPVKDVTIQIKDNMGNPMVGVIVNLFSEPQTTITDSNGMAVFHNVPYNTNDPHTLIVQDALGSEIQRYSLNFISGSSLSTSIDGNNINITFNNTIINTNIAFTMVENRITSVTTTLEYEQVKERVENPETGEDIKPSWWWIFICLVPIILYSKKKHGLEYRF